IQQHPVPQNIASFKFKLFGNLTARQFFTLIIPLSLAAVIYFSGIPSIIRYPVSFAVGGFAFFIALVPIGGRPFDKWAVAFIKAVMSPTQRVWTKEKKIPDFLTMIITPPIAEDNIPEELSSKKKERLMAYLKTLPKDNASPLDVKEEIALQDIDYSVQPAIGVSASPAVPAEKPPPPIIWPKNPLPKQEAIKIGSPEPVAQPKITSSADKIGPEPRIPSAASPRSYTLDSGFKQSNVQLPPVPHLEDIARPQAKNMKVEPPPPPIIAPHAKPYILKGVEKRIATPPPPPPEHEYVELISEPAVNLASDTNYSIDNIIPVRTWDNKIKLVHGIGTTRARKLHYAPPVNFDISKLPIRGEKRFEISDELKKRYQFENTNSAVVLPIERRPSPIPKVASQHIKPKPQNIPQKTKVAPGPTGQQVQTPPPTAAATKISNNPVFSVTDLKKQEVGNKQLSSAAIIPLTKTPNVISGQVVDAGSGPIDGAVLVVRDENGIPVRALKTNTLGQFLSATPLSSGTYTIETESQLAKFNPFSITLKNQIVPPIAINSEGELNG